MVPDFLWHNSAAVAEMSLDALDRNKMRVVPGILSKGMSVAGGYSPRAIIAPIVGSFTENSATDRRQPMPAATSVPWRMARLASSSGGHVGAADDVGAHTGDGQRIHQIAYRFLAGADHDVVDLQQPCLPVTPRRRHGSSGAGRRRRYGRRWRPRSVPSRFHLDAGPVHPADVLPQAFTLSARLALHEKDFAGGGQRSGFGDETGARQILADAPFLFPFLEVQGGDSSTVRNSVTSKPIPPAPITATRLPISRVAEYGVGVRHDHRMVDAGMSGRRGVTPVAMTT